jgi:hypothetical protein
MQGEVVRSEQEVRIAERRAAAMAESAKGEAAAARMLGAGGPGAAATKTSV